MSNNDTLKACPMCGGKAGIFRVDYHGFRVSCNTCGVETRVYENKENAIARWNRRTNNEP